MILTRICAKCGKKIKWWEDSEEDEKGKEICKGCVERLEEEQRLEEEKKLNEEKEKEIERKNEVKEYKRKCNQCGKVWHSLVDKEIQITTSSFLNALVGVGTAITGNLGASTQSSRNVDAQSERLDKLKSCPNCGSRDYTEEIMVYKKKK